ncbi:MAG: cytochrome c nitrite reductase small subunit [Thiohalospira sp.]
MTQIIKKLTPPPQWKFPVIIILGIFIGLSAYSFYISKAHSYLSDNPQTCINCHIMVPQYATWNHSSHREIAHCNECHVPHNNFFSHYYFKAKDGLRHATIFTLRAEPQVIKIKEAGIDVVQQNCLRCHEGLIKNAALQVNHKDFHSDREERLCWECHKETPHGKVKSLSVVPYARAPLPESPVPEWIKNVTNDN